MKVLLVTKLVLFKPGNVISLCEGHLPPLQHQGEVGAPGPANVLLVSKQSCDFDD